MAKNFRNPVRGQYLLDIAAGNLIRAGIRRNGRKLLKFMPENGGSEIPSFDPRSALWITSRAVGAACAKANVPVDIGVVPYAVIAPHLPKDPQAGFRPTLDHIVHMFPKELRDTPEVAAFAEAQVEELEASYKVAAKVA